MVVDSVKIVECPRDAWQGLPRIIPADEKLAYLRLLLRAGFRHIDAVSFVSPQYVPQMADSEAVMARLMAEQVSGGARAEIIGIVVNEQGLERALATPGVDTIGYPYSLSERFTRQNANMSQGQSRRLVEKIQKTLASGPSRRNLVVYISMAFGNPYGEPWEPGMVSETLEWLRTIGVRSVSLADTVGKANPAGVGEMFRGVRAHRAAMEIGAHLHSRREGATEKVLAAYEGGCRRFDSALTGLGGCPFAGDELVGNIPTEIVVQALGERGVEFGIGQETLAEALHATERIRAQYDH